MLYAFLAVDAIIALIVLLLNLNVTVRLHYDDGEDVLRVSVHYLWFKYVLLPDEESTKYLKEEKLLKKGKELNWDDEITLQGIYEEKGLVGFLEVLKVTVKNTWNLLASFLKRATLKNLEIRLNVVGSDAADTAIICGWAYSVIYPIVGAVLENVSKYEDFTVDITPDYSEGADSSVLIEGIAKIKVTKLVAMLAESGVEAENLLLVLSKNPKHTKENTK
ncbi:MAG: DUF2953 domain-containing protein [Ruminococcus sp.]